MKLLESIDRLLMESPESLGFGPKTSEAIREIVTSSRKSQDYFAQLFKNSDKYSERSGEALLGQQHFRKFLEIAQVEPVEFMDAVAKSMGKRFKKSPTGNDYLILPYDGKSVEQLISARDIENRPAFALRNLAGSHDSVGDIFETLSLVKSAMKKVGQKGKSDKVDEVIDDALNYLLKRFAKENEEIVEFLNDDENNWRKLKGVSDVRQAQELAKREMAAKSFDPSRIIMKLDGGYFWYKVPEDMHHLEGDRMQHCGTCQDGDMYSLRDENNEPHVTIDYDSHSNQIAQLRGKQNDTPARKYWDHIRAFVAKYKPEILDGNEATEFMEYITQDGGQYGEALSVMAEYTLEEVKSDLERGKGPFDGEIAIEERDHRAVDIGVLLNFDVPVKMLTKFGRRRGNPAAYAKVLRERGDGTRKLEKMLRKFFRHTHSEMGGDLKLTSGRGGGQQSLFKTSRADRRYGNAEFIYHSHAPEKSYYRVTGITYWISATDEDHIYDVEEWLETVLSGSAVENFAAEVFYSFVAPHI